MEIPYKIPKAYIIFLLAIFSLFPLGTLGFLDDSFDQSEFSQWLSILIFLGTAFYFGITPRGMKIKVSEQGIAVPKILFPPYKMLECRWEDVLSYDVKYDKNGNETLILKTRAGNIKCEVCCVSKTMKCPFNHLLTNLSITISLIKFYTAIAAKE